MGSRRTQTDDKDAKTSALAPNREQLWSRNRAKADTNRTKRPYTLMRWVVRFVHFTPNGHKRTIWGKNGSRGGVGLIQTDGYVVLAGPINLDRGSIVLGYVLL